ncbi:MAG TPA: outer membrane beta-barrel protein [Rudaea sp.]|jgi:hypothetical protein|nr:outer membrane beta-barrel protein [Rudaea sp.]
MKKYICGLAVFAASGSAYADDCSQGFIDRIAAAYRDDMNPAATDPAAPAPQRRAMDSPFSSPPFPSSEWQIGGMDYPIGVPNGNAQYPLERALACTALGQWMKDNRLEMYGWLNPSANLSTSTFSNYPLSYATRPNRVEFDQFLLRIERVPDTVQTDNVDWGFHFDNLYGYDYHYTTMKDVLSDQLLDHPNPNQPIAANAGVAGKVYGYDPMIWYVELYFPQIAQGMTVTAGRYLSLPDIEAQFAPNNYLLTHSILYTVDAYTNVGVLVSTKLSDHWTVQVGLHGGDDSAPWDSTSRLSAQACVRWVSASNNDMLYPCVESYNGDDQTYNNLQEFVVTWGHRFSENVHTLTEAYKIYVLNAPGFRTGEDPAFGIVNYFNIELNPANMLVIRNEWYKDEVGQRTGFATRYTSHTIGLTHWVSQDVELRPELRFEHSYDVAAYDDGRKRNQATALFDVILHF